MRLQTGDRNQLGLRPNDQGQVSIFVVLVVSLFLMGVVGFGVDMTNLFLHRQMAQGAADAACVAAGMDMLVNQTNGTSFGGFVRGAAYNCTTSSTDSPCQYAALNGYKSPGLTAGAESNLVSVSFPTSVPGAVVTTSVTGANPFVQVDVFDRVRVYFASLLGGGNTQTVHALAKCGLQNSTAPVPIIVLDPICAHPFEVKDTAATLQIIGGPSRSVEVNSNNACAAATAEGSCSGSGTIDLQYGGSAYTGSNFGVFGGPASAPSNFPCQGGPAACPSAKSVWQSPATPIADPWANLIAPTKPAQVDGAVTTPPDTYPGKCLTNANPCQVNYLTDGCPDTAGCSLYKAGWYANPIAVNGTAIFAPGLYYLTGSTNHVCGATGKGCISKPTGQCHAGLWVDSNGLVRPADPTQVAGDGSYGTMFYFSKDTGAGSNYVSGFFGANAGKRTVDAFPRDLGANPNYPGLGMNCPGASTPQQPTPPAPQIPASFQGDVLMGPCTGPGGTINPNPRLNYSQQGTDAVNPTNVVNYHGMLFWDDRANNDVNGQPNFSGGGGLLLAGNLYFHNCPEAPGLCAAPNTDYNAFVELNGNTGSATYIFGNITTDELVVSGSSAIRMQLNPNLFTTVLKVALLQ